MYFYVLYFCIIFYVSYPCRMLYLNFCILAFVLYFHPYMLKKKKFISCTLFRKSKKYFSGISSWHIFYHRHGLETLLFTCKYQRFLDSQALFFINRLSKYMSHNWSQMLPTFLYHSWVTWGAVGWQTCSKSDSNVSIDPSTCLANIG